MNERRYGQDRRPMAWMWVAFLVLFSLGLSRVFACATPFAAVATVATCTLPRRFAVAAVLLVWLGNQAIGFGLLHYPPTASTCGWGGAIGIAVLAALAVAQMAGLSMKRGGIGTAAVALVACFAAYEVILASATSILPSGSGVFAPMVVLRLFGINAVAFGLLLAVDRLAEAAGMLWTRALPARRG